MKYFFAFFLSVTAWQILAQVGIGTNNPDNSAQLDVSATTKGILFPRMTSVQRTSIAAPAAGLYVWDTNTKSLWFFDGVVWVNTASEATFGDVKSGIQAVDHSGWILLDGRAVNTLTATQQAAAASLGLVGNIPNATNSYLVQNGGALGAVSGSNTVTLTQGNLPNVNFTGNTSNAGTHSHTVDPAAFNSSTTGAHVHSVDPPSTGTTTNGAHNHNIAFNNDDWNACCGGNASLEDDGGNWYNRQTDWQGNHNHAVDIAPFNSSSSGDHSHSIDVPSTTSSTAPDHSHTVSVSSGGSATPVNIAPRSLTVNMFIYLGH